MRTIRALTAAAALMTALPGLATAQEGRQFRDSWFWGLKAGGFSYADSSGEYHQAPLIGAEWMITRTNGGLYIAGAQGFLSTQTLFNSNPNNPDSTFRSINLKNVRRLDVAAVGFPGQHVKWHPYVAAGFSMVQVAGASAQGNYNSVDEFTTTQALIQATRVSFTPLFMAGAQYRMKKMSVFGQLLMMGVQENWLLFNGRSLMPSYEIGVRYNIGTSISKD